MSMMSVGLTMFGAMLVLMAVRVPIAISEEPAAPVAAAAASADVAEGAPEAGEKPKRRAPRRRSPREVMDALGNDGGETPAE